MIPLWAVGLLLLAHVDLRVFSFSTGGFGKRIFHVSHRLSFLLEIRTNAPISTD